MADGVSKRAVTLIELLIVLSIMGMLVALLLPAIARSRESARRARCQNNLHQIGIAVHNYAEQHGVLPFLLGSRHVASGVGTNLKAHSAFNYLLPLLEQGALFHSLNFNVPFGSQFDENVTAIRTIVEVFLCPSDPAGLDTLNGWGPTNYRFCYGTAPTFTRGSNGVFLGFESRRLAGITDGLSNTAMVSEKARGTRSPRYESWSSIVLLSDPAMVSLTADELVTLCSTLPDPPTSHYSHTGNSWAIGNALHTCYSHVGGPNSRIPDCGHSIITGTPGIQSARSYHTGCVNVVMADGSTRAISDTISLEIWRALGTAAGGDHALD